MSESPNYCPNCGHQLSLTNHHHELDPQTLVLPHGPREEAYPPIIVEPRPKTVKDPWAGGAWVRMYLIILAVTILASVLFGEPFLIAGFAILFFMLSHTVYNSRQQRITGRRRA